MEDLRSALKDHANVVSETFEKISADLRGEFRTAYDDFVGFFHAIDWKEPWLICLVLFHVTLLLGVVFTRKNLNCQIFFSVVAFSGVYLAEWLNTLLTGRWKFFAGQNYFDTQGLFISALWSAPLLFITMVIVVNALITSCKLIIRWKRAELRHRARLARSKED